MRESGDVHQCAEEGEKTKVRLSIDYICCIQVLWLVRQQLLHGPRRPGGRSTPTHCCRYSRRRRRRHACWRKNLLIESRALHCLLSCWVVPSFFSPEGTLSVLLQEILYRDVNKVCSPFFWTTERGDNFPRDAVSARGRPERHLARPRSSGFRHHRCVPGELLRAGPYRSLAGSPQPGACQG